MATQMASLVKRALSFFLFSPLPHPPDSRTKEWKKCPTEKANCRTSLSHITFCGKKKSGALPVPWIIYNLNFWLPCMHFHERWEIEWVRRWARESVVSPPSSFLCYLGVWEHERRRKSWMGRRRKRNGRNLIKPCPPDFSFLYPHTMERRKTSLFVSFFVGTISKNWSNIWVPNGTVFFPTWLQTKHVSNVPKNGIFPFFLD